MRSGSGGKIMGADVKFESHKNEIEQAVTEALERGLNEVGLVAERYAKTYQEPHVDTGRLRSSITYATSTEHSSGSSPSETGDYALLATPDENSVYIGTNVEYAPYIEQGTSKHPAYPFIQPAIQNHIKEYKGILESELSTVN